MTPYHLTPVFSYRPGETAFTQRRCSVLRLLQVTSGSHQRLIWGFESSLDSYIFKQYQTFNFY